MAYDVEKMKEKLSEIKKEVDSAFDKVFSGNARVNDGYIDNCCSKDTLDYYTKLYECNPEAIKQMEEKKNRLKMDDIDSACDYARGVIDEI